MKLSAVMMVRNESLILPINMAYHRSLGVDEFWIVDNGSSDGTGEFLAASQRSHGDVRWQSDPDPPDQSDLTTSLAAQAIEAGADWILPIDADEFWWTEYGALKPRLSKNRDAGALVCSVDNFVQRRSVIKEKPNALMTMTYRADPIGTMASARGLVESGEIGFVEIVYPPKQILRSTPDLVIGPGNHSARNLAGPAEETSEIRVLHAPIRSRSALMRRAQDGKRQAPTPSGPNAGWHLRRWAKLADEGLVDNDWTANSQRFGRIHAGGNRHRLVRDLRLRDAVRPFVTANR